MLLTSHTTVHRLNGCCIRDLHLASSGSGLKSANLFTITKLRSLGIFAFLGACSEISFCVEAAVLIVNGAGTS